MAALRLVEDHAFWLTSHADGGGLVDSAMAVQLMALWDRHASFLLLAQNWPRKEKTRIAAGGFRPSPIATAAKQECGL